VIHTLIVIALLLIKVGLIGDLLIYRNKDDGVHSTPAGIINFSLVQAKVKITRNHKRTFVVMVDGCKRKFWFKAANQEERNQWGCEIIKHM